MKIHSFLIGLLLLLACSGCADSGPSVIPPTPSAPVALTPFTGSPDSLRSLAAQRGLLIGAAVEPDYIRNDELYGETLRREFSLVTTENVLKFRAIRPDRRTFAFHPADQVVDFALRNDMQIRGTNLVWHLGLPDWISNGRLSRAELLQILEEHIKTVVGRYKGRIQYWDVVNEAVDDDGQLRDTFWLRTIGPEYIELAFRWANEADPGAKLFYNDTRGERLNQKSDGIFILVRDLLSKGVPIHGVGLQGHVSLSDALESWELRENIARLGGLGLDVHFTEVDVRIDEPVSSQDLVAQATVFRELLKACLDEEACKVFVLWGFTDKFSWIPTSYPGFGTALIFDEFYEPKPAYWSLMEALNERMDISGRRVPFRRERSPDSGIGLHGHVSRESTRASGAARCSSLSTSRRPAFSAHCL
ncbi:MAG: 1,4-beta-xylanase [Dehalococcoidia bacterium]|nr:1,4-beta-xylanase [Dehalococcoidia bacterium]